jgi:hypothetical protein
VKNGFVPQVRREVASSGDGVREFVAGFGPVRLDAGSHKRAAVSHIRTHYPFKDKDRGYRSTLARLLYNLPALKRTQWALTKEEMKNCVWLKPELVAQIEFTEWTTDGHLRHSKFVGLREDKEAGGLTREPDS